MNVWGLPFGLARDLPQRLAAIVARLPALDADLIAFQEVWTRDAAEALAGAGAPLGYTAHRHPEFPDSGGGLLLLTRRPVRAERHHTFTLRGVAQDLHRGDFAGRKGFLGVAVDTPVGGLWVVDTHLHAQYAQDGRDPYLGHRAGQLVELASFVRGLEGPVVALGDFNLREGRPEYRVWMGLGRMRDVAVELDARQPSVVAPHPYRSAAGHEGNERIDYVFVRDGGGSALLPRRLARVFHEPLRLGERVGAYSDHCGLLAAIDVEAGAPIAGVPPPDPTAIAEAASLLAAGRAAAQARSRLERGAGLAALAASAGAIGVALRSPLSRRRLLRGLLFAGAVTGLPVAGLLSALSLRYTPSEISAFDRVATLLDPMRRAGPSISS